MIGKTKGEHIFNVLNIAGIIFICLTIIVPFLNIIALSLSSEASITAGLVKLWPVDFTIKSYEFVFSNPQFKTSLFISVSMTIIGTFISLLLAAPAAYTLSKPELKGRKKILLFFVFTMLFSGGIVPSFLTMKFLGLYNTYWVLILPAAMSVYNMLLIKNYMENLPESLEESARIDGASDLKIFTKIILPLCKPVLATVGLFFAVGYWNSYFAGIMYISSPTLKPLQTYLYEVTRLANTISSLTPAQQEMYQGISSGSIQSATIIAATIPILIVYPFLQKHFVKGIVVGTNK
ncbi:MAG: carbohydrate ABC transporter permease [Mycoplasmatales bacterium]